MKKVFKLGEVVHLPFDEIGIIVEQIDRLWLSGWNCLIMKATLSDAMTVGDFTEDQMSHVNVEHPDIKNIMAIAKQLIKWYELTKFIDTNTNQTSLQFNE